MRYLPAFIVLVGAFALSGCYHASVMTGETPGTKVVDKPWASGWLFGLVPPKTVEAAAECSNGVAMVETELSFLNQIVSALTFSLYTPMHIKVTCAAGSMGTVQDNSHPSVAIASGASESDVIDAFRTAAEQSVQTGDQVYVRFE